MLDMNEGFILKVDPNTTFSVSTQVKEQLKWLIGIGHIKPGDLLPAAGNLADQLNLNRNTINSVYNQLKDEGIVSMQAGRGTQVLDNRSVEELCSRRKPMYDLILRTIEAANAENISLDEFFTASLAFILLRDHVDRERQHILFVECKEHDHPFYRQAIENLTGAEVHTVFLEDLRISEADRLKALKSSTHIVTTLNHDTEVKDLFRKLDKKIHIIGASVDISALLDIAKLKPGSNVTFVCLGKAGAQWMASRVQEAGISDIYPCISSTDDTEHLLKQLERSDTVYASAATYNEVKALSPGKVRLYPMVLERSSEHLLKNLSSQLT